MLAANFEGQTQVVEKLDPYIVFPVAEEVRQDATIARLLADLSPETPWGERQMAARKLGRLRAPEALPALLAALSVDNFWMVRYAIIQALEMIGDPAAIPTLQEVSVSDGFQVVRSYAARVVERLSQ
jgi:HEAT repeat protein